MRQRLSRAWSALAAAVKREGSKKQRQVAAAYALWTAVFFLFFLVTTFPHGALLSHLLSSRLDGSVTVSLDDVRFALPFGYDIGKLHLGLPAYRNPPLLEASDLSIAPSITALLRLRLTPLSLTAKALGGRVQSRFDLSGKWVSLRLSLNGCQLSRGAGLRHWIAGTVGGRLDAKIELESARPGVTKNSGSLEIRLTNASIEDARLVKLGGIKIPDLHFQSIEIRGTVKNGRIQIISGVASGSELSASLTGVIMLAQPLELTALNLILTVEPTAKAPPATSLLLSLLPSRADSDSSGKRKLRIFGTLAHPRLAPT